MGRVGATRGRRPGLRAYRRTALADSEADPGSRRQRMPESKWIARVVYRPDATVTVTGAARGSGAPFGLAARTTYWPGGSGMRNRPDGSVSAAATWVPDPASMTVSLAWKGRSGQGESARTTGQPPSTVLVPVIPEPAVGVPVAAGGAGEAGAPAPDAAADAVDVAPDAGIEATGPAEPPRPVEPVGPASQPARAARLSAATAIT